MGERGRAPKRSTKRHGHRANDDVPATAPGGPSEQPPPRSGWPKLVKDFYLALGRSGESQWYQASDWAAAQILCEAMARELRPRIVGYTENGKPIRRQTPPTAAALSAWFKAMASLMVTEADRRRMHLELEPPPKDEKDADVADFTDYARRLTTG